jgi:hypothetical protein
MFCTVRPRAARVAKLRARAFGQPEDNSRWLQALCMKGHQKCDAMLRCDRDLNRCKKDKMQTDKTCSTDECKKCTSDYKSCHDTAVAQ